MNGTSSQKRIWRGMRFSVRSLWMMFLAVSLMANLALGFVNFVLQPVWRAAAVATATTAVKAKAEIQERKAVTKAKVKEQAKARAQRSAAIASAVTLAKAQANVDKKLAIAKVRAKEKAEGRIRRVAVAVPVVGVAIAGAFEYSDYLEWQADHPDGVFQDYANETLDVSMLLADEVLNELPEGLRPSREKLVATYSRLTGAETAKEEIPEQDVSPEESWIDWLWGNQDEPAPVDPRKLPIE